MKSRSWPENLLVYSKRKKLNNFNVPGEINTVEGTGSDKMKKSKWQQHGRPSRCSMELEKLSGGAEATQMDIKGKRICKVNSYYNDFEFILGNTNQRENSEFMGGRLRFFGERVSKEKLYISMMWKNKDSKLFFDCSSLLMHLIKHKYGWVFDHPVDVVKLQLNDYHAIIKHPMDLGTINVNLNSYSYKSPLDFAEDVRLTFNNAMFYNPKGHAVHAMAVGLMKIFLKKWAGIEKEFGFEEIYEVENLSSPIPCKSLVHASSFILQDFGWSSSISSHPIKTPSLRKPKANDPNKRDMTEEEKMMLSRNLECLPQYNLHSVLHIMKRREQKFVETDDSIEMDITICDAETLWELDRYFTNYMKSIRKQKRKFEVDDQVGHINQESDFGI